MFAFADPERVSEVLTAGRAAPLREARPRSGHRRRPRAIEANLRAVPRRDDRRTYCVAAFDRGGPKFSSSERLQTPFAKFLIFKLACSVRRLGVTILSLRTMRTNLQIPLFIATAINEGYLLPLRVMLVSLKAHLNPSYQPVLFLSQHKNRR